MTQLLDSGYFEANPVVVGALLGVVVLATLVYLVRRLRR